MTEQSSSLGARMLKPSNLMLFVSNWPDVISANLQTTLEKLLGDELLGISNIRAGTVLTPPAQDKVVTLAQVQQGGYLKLVLPEFEGRITMKALEEWMIACAVGVSKLAEVQGPTFLIVEPDATGKKAVLAWEYANVCPSSSGATDVEYVPQPTTAGDGAVTYELNVLGDINTDMEQVLEKAQIALDAYNNPTSAD
jgi:hypothetical protein